MRVRSANHTKERPKNEFASSCFWRIPFFLARNALPDDDKERPKNAKERLALKLCPLSGKTTFFGIALWKDRIFKRKNARPRNAGSPPQAPHPDANLAHIDTHPLFFNPPDVSRTAPAYSKMHAAPILEVSRSTTDECAILQMHSLYLFRKPFQKNRFPIQSISLATHMGSKFDYACLSHS
jgi:hypothetical protein